MARVEFNGARKRITKMTLLHSKRRYVAGLPMLLLSTVYITVIMLAQLKQREVNQVV